MSLDEQEIRAFVATWIDATKKGDIPTILDLMTEDVVFLLPGQPPMVGKAAFEAAAQAQQRAGNADDAAISEGLEAKPEFTGHSEIQEISITGDYAYMWTRLEVTVTPTDGSTPSVRAGHTLSVLKKEAGKWRIARDANLLAPVPHTKS